MKQLLHNFLNCLSVPFFDIISANNVENDDVELDEVQNTVIDSGFGNDGKKSRKEKESSVLKSGQSFETNIGQSFPVPNGGESSEPKYQNVEGECFVHISL